MNAESQECPNCGRTYWDDLHVELCRESPFAAADTCPMCGDPFDSFLDHLDRCDGGVAIETGAGRRSRGR